jgi:hypothetical protein
MVYDPHTARDPQDIDFKQKQLRNPMVSFAPDPTSHTLGGHSSNEYRVSPSPEPMYRETIRKRDKREEK